MMAKENFKQLVKKLETSNKLSIARLLPSVNNRACLLIVVIVISSDGELVKCSARRSAGSQPLAGTLINAGSSLTKERWKMFFC